MKLRIEREKEREMGNPKQKRTEKKEKETVRASVVKRDNLHGLLSLFLFSLSLSSLPNCL